MGSKKQVEERKIVVPWGHIAGKAWGGDSSSCSEKKRVLMVHGTLDNAGSFDRILPLLPDNFCYVAIDLPGHGLSSPMSPGVELNFFNYVLAVRLVLDGLEWKSCVYIGHSLGAQLGVFLTILYPGKITKLVCLDGFIPTPMKHGDLVKAIRHGQDAIVNINKSREAPLHTKDEILYALRNRRSFSLNSAAAEALFARAVTKVGNLYKYNRDLRMRNYLNPMFSAAQYLELIKQLNVPVIIILADSSWYNDTTEIQCLEMVIKNITRNCKLVRVRGNHDVHNNEPEVVAPHVAQFIRDEHKSKL